MSAVEPTGTPGGGGSVVEVRTSATAALIPTIRAVASDLAARADFDLDAISDLRMAVDEACATLVDVASPGSALQCSFTVHGSLIQVEARVDTAGPESTVSTDTFGWRVLQTLADEVELRTDGGRSVGILLNKRADPTPR